MSKPRIIKVRTATKNLLTYYVFVDHITYIGVDNTTNQSVIFLDDGKSLVGIIESIEQILTMIQAVDQ